MADSGLWKRQRIVVVLPAAEDIPTKVALSQWNLIFPPNQSCFRLAAMGMEVGAAYSETIKWILQHEEMRKWEYVLTIEHDNIPPTDDVLRLIARMEAHPEFAAISGLYWTKGEGGVPQIWGDTTDPVLNFRPQVPRKGQLVECNGIGMGFALWRMSAALPDDDEVPAWRGGHSRQSLVVGCVDIDLEFGPDRAGRPCYRRYEREGSTQPEHQQDKRTGIVPSRELHRPGGLGRRCAAGGYHRFDPTMRERPSRP